MLPGLRFLCAAIALSVSVLVFGLGGAAFLRATHERFLNARSIQVAPNDRFARQSDAPQATLSMLRFEPPASDLKSSPQPVSLTTPLREPDPLPDPVALTIQNAPAPSPPADRPADASGASDAASPAAEPSSASQSGKPAPATIEEKRSEPAAAEPPVQTAAVAPAADSDPAPIAGTVPEPPGDEAPAAISPSDATLPAPVPLPLIRQATLGDPSSVQIKPVAKPVVKKRAQVRRVRRHRAIVGVRPAPPPPAFPASPFGTPPRS